MSTAMDLRRVYHCIEQWLEIKSKVFDETPSQQIQCHFSACDAEHSSLLARLISGREPLKFPPPRSYSYPWYNLVEQGFANNVEVNLSAGKISINQNQTQWKVESVEHEWKYIIRCLTNNKRYVLQYKNINSEYVWCLDELNTKDPDWSNWHRLRKESKERELSDEEADELRFLSEICDRIDNAELQRQRETVEPRIIRAQNTLKEIEKLITKFQDLQSHDDVGVDWVHELNERSKDDKSIIVGSEIRKLCKEIFELRKKLESK